MADYINPHNGQIMKSVYVNEELLYNWHDGWKPSAVDYSKPFGVIGMNPLCDCDDIDCKYHEPMYELIQHTLYPDGVLFECPVRFTTND